MSIISRFFGRKEKHAEQDQAAALVANPAITDPLALTALLMQPSAVDAQNLVEALQATDNSLAGVRVDIDPELSAQGNLFGLVGWGRHVVKLVGFDAPMTGDALEACLAPSHYGQELKVQARAHRAIIILYYGGYETAPLEQYVALGLVAGALARLGAVVIVNETARTSIPAALLSDDEIKGDLAGFLREGMPLLMLFSGFVKYEVEGVCGVWMRTYGAHCFGLPDLALLAASHAEGEQTFGMFGNLLAYLLDSGAKFATGDTMQIGENSFLRLRAPMPEEHFLESAGQLFVGEVITEAEINH